MVHPEWKEFNGGAGFSEQKTQNSPFFRDYLSKKREKSTFPF
jgi:hypothetical protein